MRRRAPDQLDIPFEHYVFDSSALIDLEASGKLRKVRTPGSSVWVPERVKREVDTPGSRLRRWLRANPGVVTKFATTGESSLYVRLLQHEAPKVHDGEAAAIAIAAQRDAVLVTNDGASQEKAREYHVRQITDSQFLDRWWRARRPRVGS